MSPSPSAGSSAPTSGPARRARAGSTSVGPSPRNTQAPASRTIAARMDTGASWARAAASLRGTARNVMPAAFTKHASVSPLVSASAASPNVNVRLSSSRAI